MNEPVSQMVTLLCNVVRTLPVGTNLALLHLLWMLVSGCLLLSRGAIIPGLQLTGLSKRAILRSWQALRRGGWNMGRLLANWEAAGLIDGHWQARYHGGYCALPIDVTGFWRPRLKNCPTKHYDQRAGKALPAIVLGIIGHVGQVGQQRLLLPLAFLRADPTQPNEGGLVSALVAKAKELMQPQDVLVSDGGFPLELVQAKQVPRYVVKLPKNFTARRAQPPAYGGKGRPAERGLIVRPLARSYRGHMIAATPPDRSETWEEDGLTIRADIWDHLILKEVKPEALTDGSIFSVIAFHNPKFAQPLLVATPLPAIAARNVCQLYLDRWPVEQLPLAAKQMIGAHRAFVFAAEVCQRLPELALLAGTILSYAAAILPAIPTGFWDRTPQPTPGRLRRFLARSRFPTDFPLPPEIRQKASFTDHLPKGSSLFRRTKRLETAT
jgi:hypothetical protein